MASRGENHLNQIASRAAQRHEQLNASPFRRTIIPLILSRIVRAEFFPHPKSSEFDAFEEGMLMQELRAAAQAGKRERRKPFIASQNLGGTVATAFVATRTGDQSAAAFMYYDTATSITPLRTEVHSYSRVEGERGTSIEVFSRISSHAPLNYEPTGKREALATVLEILHTRKGDIARLYQFDPYTWEPVEYVELEVKEGEIIDVKPHIRRLIPRQSFRHSYDGNATLYSPLEREALKLFLREPKEEK